MDTKVLNLKGATKISPPSLMQTLLKNTRRIDLESAMETWHELLTQDWELMEHQISDSAA